ncbi:MAG: lipopolysaccharide heptosyltransferase II [Sulfurospirillaceae bacterium]|nr:lipopolysaccharide heptosyltransferase II [Sulfurospirillaceae bacterium]
MRILIEVPTWLGDSVMSTPAIEEIIKIYPDAKIVFFGSFVSTEALKSHPNCEQIKIDESKKSKCRLLWLRKTAQTLGTFDLAFSFRSSFTSKVFLWFLNAKQKFQYKKNTYNGHQVQKYATFVSKALNVILEPQSLKLYQIPHLYNRSTLGINPGATYGSAKRWYPEEFAKVAEHFAKDYDIVIFGGPNEQEIANEVEKLISNAHVTNLAGKTSITELIEKIAGLNLFITNDSGPMHCAAAYKVPTVALFGPTIYTETSQWENPNGYLISHDLDCAPCMKRICPIKTHECMKSIKAQEVITLLENHLSLDR